MPKLYASAVISAPADEVWAFVRDFANFADWHPTIDTCEIEDGDVRVGCVRRMTGARDSVFRERLLALSDIDRSYTYEFVESPFPIRRYESTMRVTDVTATGQAFVEWSGEYDADESNEGKMTKILSEAVFGAGLDALSKRFG